MKKPPAEDGPLVPPKWDRPIPHETISDTGRPIGSFQHSPKQVPPLDHKGVSSQHSHMDPWTNISIIRGDQGVPPLHTHTRDRGEGPQAREVAPPISGGSLDPLTVTSRAYFHSTDLGYLLEEQAGPTGQWMGSLDPLPVSIQVGWCWR